MWLELIYYVLVSAIYAFYKWATVNKDYFSTRGISHLKPKFLIGNTFGLLSKQYKPTEFLDSIYYRFPNEKYVYTYILMSPLNIVIILIFCMLIVFQKVGWILRFERSGVFCVRYRFYKANND